MEIHPVKQIIGVMSILLWGLTTTETSAADKFSSDTRWITQDTQVELTLPLDTLANLAFYIGKTDISPLFQSLGKGRFRYQANVLPLPKGENTIHVYQRRNNQWEELKRIPIRVLSAYGFEQSRAEISGTVSIDSRLDSGQDGDAPPPERAQFHDGSLQVGLSTHHKRGVIEVISSANIVGNSHRPQALRYSDRKDEAPRVDLSDYVVDAKIGAAAFSLGHTSHSSNPLLAPNIANRGAAFSYQLSERIDFSSSLQNATAIAGFNNIFGLQRSRHSVRAGKLGVETFPSEPSRMRLEVSYVAADKLAEDNFGVGEITDAEVSEGWGLQLKGNEFSGRLRYDFALARNAFTNPNDPFLSQDANVVPVAKETANARRFEMAYQILEPDFEQPSQTRFSVSAFHERTNPLYRSITAFPTPDLENNRVDLNASRGEFSLSAGYQWQEDNLDNIPSILKTQTRSGFITLNAALKEWLSAADASAHWWPDLSISASHIHQYADNQPPTDESDFNADSHLPDQTNENANVELTWTSDIWNLSYLFDYSFIDNRQTGRGQADFRNRGHGVNLSFNPNQDLALDLGWQSVRNLDLEQSFTGRQNNLSAGLRWHVNDQLAISMNLSSGREHDSLNLSEQDSRNLSESDHWTGDASLTYQFSLPGQLVPVNGQAFLRYSHQSNDSTDHVFGFNTDSELWTLASGISISF